MVRRNLVINGVLLRDELGHSHRAAPAHD